MLAQPGQLLVVKTKLASPINDDSDPWRQTEDLSIKTVINRRRSTAPARLQILTNRVG